VTVLWPGKQAEALQDQKRSLTAIIQKLRLLLDKDHDRCYIERGNSEVHFVYRPVITHYTESLPQDDAPVSGTGRGIGGTRSAFGSLDIAANQTRQEEPPIPSSGGPIVGPIAKLGYADLLRSLHPISAEIAAFGKRHGVTPVDQYLQLRASPSWLGWPPAKVATFPDVPAHEELPELKRLMERFPPEGAINLLYSLQGYECGVSLDDEIVAENDIPCLKLTVTGGSWRNTYALQQSWLRTAPTASGEPPDRECAALHRRFEEELSGFLTNHRSSLYHNANVEAILITSDNKIILAKRSGTVTASRGLWSASFEEQVLCLRKRDQKSDRGDLFACAQRGAWEEFGVTIIPEASRLLALGVEWGNFTAAFIVLLRCRESYEEICNWSWGHLAGDPSEAVAIDCMNAQDEEEIRGFFLREEWIPSPTARRSNLLPSGAPDPLKPSGWHPVARARLLAYLLHKDSGS
jgi:hypothetical protein